MRKYFYRLIILSGIISNSISPQAHSQSPTDFTLISDRIFATFQSAGAATLDTQTAALLATLRADYSWPDIDYTSTSQTDWAPANHLTRMGTMAKAYSSMASTYYADASLRIKIEGVMNYWLGLNPEPNSTNWFYRTISVPRDIGNTLICLRKSAQGISQSLEGQMLAWMIKGTPITVSPAKDGSNLTDVAQHYIMRACLKEDQSLLNETITAVTNSILVTTEEGIQADHSYTAHGPQLYVYGYGREYISGISNIAVYVAGTSYAFSSNKLAIFSDFVRKGFIKPSRGAYTDYNLYGRGVSRPNAGRADVALIEKVKSFDLAAHADEYQYAIDRMRALQPPSYNVLPEHVHYWRTDYTVHHRPGYMFGQRSVSSRNAKSEMGNGENIKGYYLTEGASYIAVRGDEYFNIFPVWDWNKVPGTTVPEITNYPVRPSWGVNFGTAAFTGGVSDGIYGASVYAMNDYGTSAKKSWFYFDDEIVCLGAGINSSAPQAINTTVNQSLLKTDVTIADAAGLVSVLGKGSHEYAGGLKWVLQDNIGYFFPQAGAVSVSNQVQTGSWASINTTGSASPVSSDVFKLWIKHGTSPINTSYAYIVAPGKSSAADMQAYNIGNVEILSNTAAVQAVRHKPLGILQVVFYKPGEFSYGQVKVRVSKACVVMLKNPESAQVSIHVADPTQNTSLINVGVENAVFTAMKSAVVNMPAGANAGSSVAASITGSSPNYQEPVDPYIQLVSTADAFVRSGGTGSTAGYATTNYGSEPVLTLKTESAGYDRQAFIQFDLNTVKFDPDSAVVQLRVNNANTSVTSTKWALYLVEDNSWTETGITWANKPAHTTKLAEIQGAPAGSTIRFNVSAAVAGRLAADKVLSLHLVCEPNTADPIILSKTDAAFNARESTNALYRPQIWIYGRPPAVTDPQTDSITAFKDAYVRSNSNASVNYGSQGYLVARNATNDVQETFFAFDLHGMRPGVTGASVRLWAIENGISTSWNMYQAGNNYSTSAVAWQETGVNWNNKPASGELIAGSASAAAAGYVSFDITQALPGIGTDSILTVRVATTSNVYSSFRSRNFATDALRPKLFYSYSTAGASLPVALVRFQASAKDGLVSLSWETAGETNNDYFEIERSLDARNFEVIARVPGSGTTSLKRKYTLADSDILQAGQQKIYYRLTQVDYDGTTARSSMIAVSLKNAQKVFSIGPNPACEWINVFLGDSSGSVTLTILDNKGLTMAQKSVAKSPVASFETGRYLPGNYLLIISKDGQPAQTLRFVIVK